MCRCGCSMYKRIMSWIPRYGDTQISSNLLQQAVESAVSWDLGGPLRCLLYSRDHFRWAWRAARAHLLACVHHTASGYCCMCLAMWLVTHQDTQRTCTSRCLSRFCVNTTVERGTWAYTVASRELCWECSIQTRREMSYLCHMAHKLVCITSHMICMMKLLKSKPACGYACFATENIEEERACRHHTGTALYHRFGHLASQWHHTCWIMPQFPRHTRWSMRQSDEKHVQPRDFATWKNNPKQDVRPCWQTLKQDVRPCWQTLDYAAESARLCWVTLARISMAVGLASHTWLESHVCTLVSCAATLAMTMGLYFSGLFYMLRQKNSFVMFMSAWWDKQVEKHKTELRRHRALSMLAWMP